MTTRRRHRPAEWLMLACAIWQVGLGLYFIFVRPPLLPEDVRYMGFASQLLAAASPGLAEWLPKVFTVAGGFMVGAGVITAHYALEVMPARIRGTALVLALAGATTVGLMSAVNFALHSDFRWLLVLPPLSWILAWVLYVRSGI